MISVKQIKEWPIGYKSGGFELIAKTIKKRTDINERAQSQRLILTDGKDDILADLGVRRGFSITPNTRIHITVCERNERDINNRMVPALIIDQWHLDLPKTTSDEYLNGPDMLDGWRGNKKEIIGKCRTLYVCAREKVGKEFDPKDEKQRKHVNRVAEFMYSGE